MFTIAFMATVYIHIPKTAGTTFQEVLRKNISEGEIAHIKNQTITLQAVLEKSKTHTWVLGHMRFYKEVKDQGNFLFTFLRNPIDRMVSHFFHLVRNGQLEGKTILDKFEFYLTPEQEKERGLFNQQTQILANYQKQSDFRAGPEQALKTALNHLEMLDFVGITEYFRESVLILGKELGWKKLYYTNRNQTTNSQEKEVILKQYQKQITLLNELDFELYERGIEMLKSYPKPSGLDWSKSKGLSWLKSKTQ